MNILEYIEQRPRVDLADILLVAIYRKLLEIHPDEIKIKNTDTYKENVLPTIESIREEINKPIKRKPASKRKASKKKEGK